jgi:hypothetical protein
METRFVREKCVFLALRRVLLITVIVDDDFDHASSADEEDDGDSTDGSSMDVNDEHTNEIHGPVEDSSTGFVVFRCSDPQCIKWYRSLVRCEDHIVAGEHVYPNDKPSLFDAAITKFKAKADRIDFHGDLTSAATTASSASTSSSSFLNEGWALIKQRTSRRFTPEQIAYLVEKYEEGERSGNKWNPAAVASVSFILNLHFHSQVVQTMRVALTHGKLRFAPDDHLTTTQVKSYFSKLTSLRRQQSQRANRPSSSRATNIGRITSAQVHDDHDVTNDSTDVDDKEADDDSLVGNDDNDENDDDDDDYDGLNDELQRQQLRSEANRMLRSNVLWDATDKNP